MVYEAGRLDESASIGHELPDKFRRIDLPVVCEYVGLAENQFGAWIKLDRDVTEVQRDRIENLLGNFQQPGNGFGDKDRTAPAQLNAVGSQLASNFQRGVGEFAAIGDRSVRQDAGDHFRTQGGNNGEFVDVEAVTEDAGTAFALVGPSFVIADGANA